MKTIGLIGGMSWQSSAHYYRIVNETVAARLGGSHSARLLMVSVDFAEIARLQHASDWPALRAAMTAAAKSLVRGGADMVLICTNTMHLTADAVAGAIEVPLLHIADAVAAPIVAAGHRRVALLGTAFTMEQPFYRERLATRHGLEVIVPDAADRAVVHDIIYGELVRGEVRDASRAAYRAIIAGLVAAGAEAVILGCTEIMLLIGAEDCAVPVYDTTYWHAVAAVDAALG